MYTTYILAIANGQSHAQVFFAAFSCAIYYEVGWVGWAVTLCFKMSPSPLNDEKYFPDPTNMSSFLSGPLSWHSLDLDFM